jgi:hypothetical protein
MSVKSAEVAIDAKSAVWRWCEILNVTRKRTDGIPESIRPFDPPKALKTLSRSS